MDYLVLHILSTIHRTVLGIHNQRVIDLIDPYPNRFPSETRQDIDNLVDGG
jgi:hypothetical protein